MKNAKKYLRLIITSHSGISSKRVCGLLGFLVITFVIAFCTVCNLQAPVIVEPFIWAVCALLGRDSITGIWKNFNKNET